MSWETIGIFPKQLGPVFANYPDHQQKSMRSGQKLEITHHTARRILPKWLQILEKVSDQIKKKSLASFPHASEFVFID